MLAKRFAFLMLFVISSFPATSAFAQAADAAFVAGGSFVSDSSATFGIPCLLPPCPVGPTFISTVQTDHQVFLEGAVALRLLSVKVVSLHLEVPFAGIPSQTLHLTTTPSSILANMSSTYVTPGFRLKLAPGAPISPYVSLGGGWAHYSLAKGATNKGAIDYAGGIDFKTGLPFLGFRGEVRDFVSGDPNFSLANPLAGGFKGTSTQSGLHRHNILAGGGIVLRF
jgi:hypothetical protein